MERQFTHRLGDKYIVTGLYANSTKKFRNVYTNPFHAMGINLWNGRVWQLRNGKRTLIKRVVN